MMQMQQWHRQELQIAHSEVITRRTMPLGHEPDVPRVAANPPVEHSLTKEVQELGRGMAKLYKKEIILEASV